MQGQQAAEARTLCAAATARGITCALHAQPDRHTWQFAGRAFTAVLVSRARNSLKTTSTPRSSSITRKDARYAPRPRSTTPVTSGSADD
jgi:hypothetical protein